ncbi:hypothetical protein KFE25_008728 [Diacronema lutheri]|uniref:Denticleless protein homolog n=1 Tax=Diacronema lutheri TaxID=2081491 RepID=A0A8J5XX43_DIALT|nr:hypothetical protein KFE25_008728 [Diacronema lutheri]
MPLVSTPGAQPGGRSVAQAIMARELGRTRCRPILAESIAYREVVDFDIVSVDGQPTLPFALKFARTPRAARRFAVADEEGTVALFELSATDAAEHALRCRWDAHSNAIFDLAWLDDDRHLVTASGDQTFRMWDVETARALHVGKGHAGSIKSVATRAETTHLIATGGRDGHIMLWDTRAGSSDHALSPVLRISRAHHPNSAADRRKRARVECNKSVTSVHFLPWEHTLASAGASDGKIKFWDLRGGSSSEQLYHIDATPAASGHADGVRTRGFSCLDVDGANLRLLGGTTGGKIHVYDLMRPQMGATHTLEGHTSETFYVKAVFSPDGRHVASGSSDKIAYLWDLHDSDAPPLQLAGHAGEVTTLDFCHARESGLRRGLASCSDDGTVRVWTRETASERTFITPQRAPRAPRTPLASPADGSAEPAAEAARADAAASAARTGPPLSRVRTIDDFWRASAPEESGDVTER